MSLALRMAAAMAGGGGVSDPQWANTKLLLQGSLTDTTGTNTVTAGGNCAISSSQKLFGMDSIYFDGTGDYFTVNNLPALGTGVFTHEFYIRPDSVTGFRELLSYNGASLAMELFIYNGNLYMYSGSNLITGTAVLSTGTWYHVALCRSGTSTKLFVDGVQDGSTYTNANNWTTTTNRPVFGTQNGSSNPYQGYMNMVRTTIYARYTSNFTKPSAAFPTS